MSACAFQGDAHEQSPSQHGRVYCVRRPHVESGGRGGGGDAAASNLQGGFEAWHAGENLDMLPHPEATDKTHVVVRTPEHPENGWAAREGCLTCAVTTPVLWLVQRVRCTQAAPHGAPLVMVNDMTLRLLPVLWLVHIHRAALTPRMRWVMAGARQAQLCGEVLVVGLHQRVRGGPRQGPL
jgi:hypothetical protein